MQFLEELLMQGKDDALLRRSFLELFDPDKHANRFELKALGFLMNCSKEEKFEMLMIISYVDVTQFRTIK